MEEIKKLVLKEKVFLLLLLASFLSSILKINFIAGIVFNFTSVFFLIITKKFGVRRALIAVMLIEGLPYILYGNDRFILLKILEVLFFTYILKRKEIKHLILIDLAFWGMSLVVITGIFILMLNNSFDFKEFYFNLFILSVNSIVNAEIADVLMVFYPLKNIIKKEKNFIVSFKDIIFHVIVVMVLFPYTISAIFGTIKQYEAIIRTNAQVSDSIKNNVEEYLNTWDETKKGKLLLNSKIETGELKNNIVKITDENNFGVIVTDKRNRLLVSNNRSNISFDEYSDIYYKNEVYKNTYEVIIDNKFNKGNILYKYDLLNGKLNLVVKVSMENFSDEVINYVLNQLIALFMLTIISSGGALIINRFLTKSIDRLIEITSSTQQFINRGKDNVALKSNVEEINILEQNYENMLIKLKESFDEIQDSKSNLERLAYTDYLTGLNNRLAFSKIIECKTQSLNSGILALILMDINKFKHINDTLGHAAGDELLIEVSRRLNNLKREGFYIFRQGGDEIAIIVEASSRDSIIVECDKICKIFEEPFELFDKNYNIKASIGVSIYPEDTRDLEELMRFSDMAMYKAKKKNVKGAILHNKGGDE